MKAWPTFQALALYLAAVEHGTLRAAATAEAISQPAISTHIKGLERLFGTALMERAGRRLRPTPVGLLVADYARGAVTLLDELERAVADLKGVRGGHLVLGASATIAETLLPAAIGRFRQSYPEVDFTLRVGNSTQIIQAVLARALKLGFVGSPPADPALLLQPVFDDFLEIFVAPNSPYLNREPPRLADLAGETFVLREPGSATRELALGCLAARGFASRKVVEFGSNEAVKRAVAAGIGIGILSTHTLEIDCRAGAIAPLPCPDWDCRRQFWLIRRADRPLSHAEGAFVTLLGLGEGEPAAESHAASGIGPV